MPDQEPPDSSEMGKFADRRGVKLHASEKPRALHGPSSRGIANDSQNKKEPALANQNAKKLSSSAVVGILGGGYILLSFLQRITYLIWILSRGGKLESDLPLAVFRGLVFDVATAFFLFIPVVLVLLLSPRRLSHRRWFHAIVIFLSAFPLFLACCAAFGEIFFWDEFHARYNFIAVDYLIYTTEVVRNIVESYSLPVLIAGILIPAIILAVLVRALFLRWDAHIHTSTRGRWRNAIFLGLAVLCAGFVSEDALLGSATYWTREISKNSIFALFSAYNRNSITYREFYTSLDEKEALKLTSDWLKPQTTQTDLPLEREVKAAGPEHKWNVMLVAMESMSAHFLGKFGDTTGITPNLDRLADNGWFWNHLYATGTRTVRGLEALMLSLPPTPGQSILRRPGSDGLFNLGSVFSDKGYKTQFVYGGYAYFDNMKEWFEGNGFEVVDRGQFPKSEIHFGNAWGVCDEDLFDQVLKQQEKITSAGGNFFQVVLTTSNHRPYTYPEGRIDMPPHNGREGAIKYSDYAIGRFIDQVKDKPWYKNTIFIFVADHDASVAGGTDIPVKDFLIPAIFYNPELIPAHKMEKLASQIDLGPSLLGLLNFSYKTKFFGQDVALFDAGRALLGTYQKVALLEQGSMSIIAPGDSVETQTLNPDFSVAKTNLVRNKTAAEMSSQAKLTVSIYQTASDLFASGKLKKDK